MPLAMRIVCSQEGAGASGCHKREHVKKRVEMVRGDLKMVVEQRRANLMAFNTSFHEAFSKEQDMRQALFEKWSAIAKEDIETLCKMTPHSKNKTEVVVAAPEEAFYEPWVKDD